MPRTLNGWPGAGRPPVFSGAYLHAQEPGPWVPLGMATNGGRSAAVGGFGLLGHHGAVAGVLQRGQRPRAGVDVFGAQIVVAQRVARRRGGWRTCRRTGPVSAGARRTRRPGTFVLIGLNVPRYSRGRSGFRSKVSRCEGPPARWMKMPGLGPADGLHLAGRGQTQVAGQGQAGAAEDADFEEVAAVDAVTGA